MSWRQYDVPTNFNIIIVIVHMLLNGVMLYLSKFISNKV